MSLSGAAPLSNTVEAVFVYGPCLFGLSYTIMAVFVYEPLVFGLSYTKWAVFVYEPCLFGPSYTKCASFVYGDREVSPLNSQKRGSPGHFAPDSSLLRSFGP